MERILIHALAVWPETQGRCKIRATVRAGEPKAGDEVWFEGRDLQSRRLVVQDVRVTPRLSTIALEGDPDDVDALEGGMYLHSRDWEMTSQE
jgi:hypothetical protein